MIAFLDPSDPQHYFLLRNDDHADSGTRFIRIESGTNPDNEDDNEAPNEDFDLVVDWFSALITPDPSLTDLAAYHTPNYEIDADSEDDELTSECDDHALSDIESLDLRYPAERESPPVPSDEEDYSEIDNDSTISCDEVEIILGTNCIGPYWSDA